MSLLDWFSKKKHKADEQAMAAKRTEQVQAAARLAREEADLVNMLLKSANDSKDVDAKQRALRQAKESLSELKKIAKKYPFIELMQLEQVESNIKTLETEFQQAGYRESAPSPNLTQGAREFLEGKRNVLSTADVDLQSVEDYGRYERAMALKKEGRLSDAAKLLLGSCESPSIYKGHYRELFRIWRQLNRDDLKSGRYQEVADRVLTMRRFDDEMIKEMLRYWSIVNKKKLPSDYFDDDRNLLVSDAKALKKAAEALKQEDNMGLATELIQSFAAKRDRWFVGSTLEEQCSAISWSLDKISAIHSGKRMWTLGEQTDVAPEIAVAAYFAAAGESCSWCKGGSVKTLIKAAALDVLAPYSILKTRTDAARDAVESHFLRLKKHRDEILSAIRSISTVRLKNNVEEILSDDGVQMLYPRVTPEFVISLSLELGNEAIAGLADVLFRNASEYGKGWPDLTVIGNQGVHFIEVKTTDLLGESQVRFAREVAAPLGLRCGVVQLIPAKE